ncbi:tail tube [Synechococcus phage BUCT-ZZ01]|nr:tail tube [Synechococcus phage BUCT-ZZ01]
MTIALFKNALIGGGARPSLFRVTLQFPGLVAAGAASAKSQFLVKASNIPAARIGQIPVPFQGRTVKFKGDREYDDWNITVINDTDFAIRSALEDWVELMQSGEFNTSPAQTANLYQTDMTVTQLDQNQLPLRTYKFVNCFPTNVDAINLSYDASNQIEEFGVTFSVDYWKVV